MSDPCMIGCINFWEACRGTERCRISWTIPHFANRKEDTGCYIPSPEFHSRSDKRYKWFLAVFPNGRTEEFKNYVSLYLCVKCLGDCAVCVFAKVGLVNCHNQEDRVGPLKYQFTVEGEGRGYGRFISRQELCDPSRGLLSQGALTLFCEVRRPTGEQEVCLPEPEACHIIDMTNLLARKPLTDITLVCCDGELQAHKALLVARSPVMAEIINERTEAINMDDVETEVVCEFLLYIYTGRCSDLDGKAERLLPLAEKYCLGLLKDAAVVSLLENLCVKNAAHLLVLSQNYEEMKMEVVRFVSAFLNEVMATTGWEEYVVPKPQMMADILRTMVAK